MIDGMDERINDYWRRIVTVIDLKDSDDGDFFILRAREEAESDYVVVSDNTLPQIQ